MLMKKNLVQNEIKKHFPRVKYDNLTVFYGTKCGSKISSFFKEENDLSKAMIDSQVERPCRQLFFSVGNPKFFCYNFNTANHGGLKNIILKLFF
jgi:hypothetical protein